MLARGCISKDGDLTILKAITSIGRAHWCLVRVTRESRFGYMAYSQFVSGQLALEKTFLLAPSLNNLVAASHGHDAEDC